MPEAERAQEEPEESSAEVEMMMPGVVLLAALCVLAVVIYLKSPFANRSK